jgi:PAS domain S-box-containing protein
VTTTQGQRLTLVNPAYMTRMVHELGTNAYGLKGHITSLRPIRPENAPDPWERKALQAFERGTREFSEVVQQDGHSTLRFMGAFLVEASCLGCHAHQGYQLGEVRGGISVTVPVGTGPAALGLSHREISILTVMAFWGLGCAGLITWVRRRTRAQEIERGLVQQFQDSAEKFEGIRNTTPDGLWLLDQEGRIQWVNDAYCRFTGYAASELVGQPVTMVEAMESPEDTSRRLEQLLGTAGSLRFRTRHHTKGGGEVHLEVTTSMLPSRGQIVAFFRDITQEIETSRQIQESETRFRRLFESSPAPMFIERDGRIIYANRAIASLAEADSPADLLGRRALDLLDPDEPSVASEQPGASPAEAPPLPVREERLVSLRGRSHWVEVQAVPIDLPEGPARLVFAQDLTDRKQAEEDRRTLEAEVQHAQKLDSLGSLAGGIAHDMNNVLAAILGMSTLLQARATNDEGLAKSLQIIEKAAGRGRDLVKGLTDFARKGLQEPQVMDLNGLVREELDLLVRTSRHRFRFDTQLEEGLPPILAEPSTLGSAFMNLCVNAFDAMPNGGTLKIRTRSHEQQVMLEVTDTGMGIPAHILPRITEPFFTTKPPGRGTGLGLAMVFGTVKAHGGTLDIQSKEGVGTRICMAFPAMSPASKETNQPPLRELPADRPLQILVVDDDALMRNILSEMLEGLGHRVETASSGLEALRRLTAGLEADLVILDHNMPGLTGAETLPRLMQLRPHLRVLIATGFLDDELRRLLAEFPAVLAVQKPFSLTELNTLIRAPRHA